MSDPLRTAWVDFPRELVDSDTLRMLISDALEDAGLSEDDRWFLRLTVIELPEDATA